MYQSPSQESEYQHNRVYLITAPPSRASSGKSFETRVLAASSASSGICWLGTSTDVLGFEVGDKYPGP